MSPMTMQGAFVLLMMIKVLFVSVSIPVMHFIVFN